MAPHKVGALNNFFDEWRGIIYVVTALGVFGGGVIIPNTRISDLQAEQSKDRKALEETGNYLRVLATAQCLDSKRPTNRLMEQLCERVIGAIVAPPTPQP